MNSSKWAACLVLGFGAGCCSALAQYPGQVKAQDKDQPILRAISVLEWTGEAGKPKTSRMIPVAVFDGQTLQDGGIYLARPAPLALESEVEYELRENGKNVGIYVIHGAGQQQGSWVGFGAWKPMPTPKPPSVAKIDDSFSDKDDDRPTLHRKHQKGDKGSSNDRSSAPPPDPDRPTLHRTETGSNSSTAGDDTDRPTLHQKTSSKSGSANSDNSSSSASGSTASSSAPAPDPDRPVLHHSSTPEQVTNASATNPLPAISDPDRPRLIRGKPKEEESIEAPSLVGLPQQMHQMVAVSDARNRPEHIWTYSWSNPEDVLHLKAELEQTAREALGLTAPVAATKPKVPHTKSRASKAAHAKVAVPPEPPQLVDEDFRVFQLTYGSSATMVLTAHSAGDLADQKFVTLIAQPDLYGNIRIIFKNLTDGRHLDVTPHMRLVDAVDALSDNRGELLFELRGRTQRRFALYRVYRGQVEQIFSTSGEYIAAAAGE
ncbi:MAG: hypothetical protein KGN79_03000 [Acidobacteriota bacterium]|nr:hypothetical protein [Acidobacteriota bacterium]